MSRSCKWSCEWSRIVIMWLVSWPWHYKDKANRAIDVLSHFFFKKSDLTLLHQVLIYRMPVLSLLLQFWRCTPEEDIPAQDLDGDAWWLGKISKQLYIIKAYFAFLRLSKLSWLATLTLGKLENLLLGNTIETCSCFQYLLIVKNASVIIQFSSLSIGL